MKTASEMKKFADTFNDPEKKQKRINDIADHVVDFLLDDCLAAAKRGAYETEYSLEEMTKERIRLSGLSEKDVMATVCQKMIQFGFSILDNDSGTVVISWK